MANNLTSNPKYIDTAASSTLTGIRRIRLIQWIDDNADIADDDDLAFTLNGVPIAIKVQKPTDVGHQDPVVYSAGPFNPGIPCKDFVVDTIDHGVVLVWHE